MLQWILEEAIPRRYTDVKIIERILLVNFAAIHTSSMVREAHTYSECIMLTYVLYHRASRTLSSTSPRTHSTSDLSVRRSRPSSRSKVGRRPLWGKCGRSTASSRNHSATMASASVCFLVSHLDGCEPDFWCPPCSLCNAQGNERPHAQRRNVHPQRHTHRRRILSHAL